MSKCRVKLIDPPLQNKGRRRTGDAQCVAGTSAPGEYRKFSISIKETSIIQTASFSAGVHLRPSAPICARQIGIAAERL